MRKVITQAKKNSVILVNNISDEVIVLYSPDNQQVGLLVQREFEGDTCYFQDMTKYGIRTGNRWDAGGTYTMETLIEKLTSYEILAFDKPPEAYRFIAEKLEQWNDC